MSNILGISSELTTSTKGLNLDHEPLASVWDGFTNDGSGGNRAGIVFPANKLSGKDRQRLATQNGYSETAFLSLDPITGEFEVEFFTPVERIAMCGHALTACGAYLSRLGLLRKTASINVTNLGKVRVLGDGKTGGLTLFDHGSSSLQEEKMSTSVDRAIRNSFPNMSVFGDTIKLSMGVPFLMIRTDQEPLKSLMEGRQNPTE